MVLGWTKTSVHIILMIPSSTHSPTGILMLRECNILSWVFLTDRQSKKLKNYVENICEWILKGKLGFC